MAPALVRTLATAVNKSLATVGIKITRADGHDWSDVANFIPFERTMESARKAGLSVGDYVVPVDLPRQFVCRVTCAHPVEDTPLQVLELAPLEGPWPSETRLVRGGDSVRPAAASELTELRRARAMHTTRSLRPHRATRADRRAIRTARRLEVSSAR